LKTQHEKHNVRKSLKFSVLDASAYAVMLGLTQNYVTPLALELKATTGQVGLLSSMPSLMMALSQLIAPNLSERAGSRKGFILPVVFGHALLFIPILLVHYVFHDSPVWWLIGFVTISSVLGSLANPAWGSMMADLVPQRLRGRYFGSRGRIAGFITLVFFFIAGVILQYYNNKDIFTGYSILFGGATLFRLLSGYFLSRQYEPVEAEKKEDSPGLVQLIKTLGSSNLGKFTLYVALIDLCTCISSPFFSVYMLRDLHFSYLNFVLVSSCGTVANLLFLTFWGRRADKAGNIKIVRLTSLLLPVIPVLWLASTNVYYLMAANLYSGFVWSGYSLTAVNFVYDASKPEIRTRQIAIFNAVDLIACCGGALVGGYIAQHLPVLLGYQLRSLFTLSGVMRALVVILLLRQIVEVRRVPEMNTWQVITGRSNNDKH
jgi:MFS family permease